MPAPIGWPPEKLGRSISKYCSEATIANCTTILLATNWDGSDTAFDRSFSDHQMGDLVI